MKITILVCVYTYIHVVQCGRYSKPHVLPFKLTELRHKIVKEFG